MNFLIKLLGGYTKDDVSTIKAEIDAKHHQDLEIMRQKQFRVGDMVYNHSDGYSLNMMPLYISKVRLGLRGDIVLELLRNEDDKCKSLDILAKFASFDKPNVCGCCGKIKGG